MHSHVRSIRSFGLHGAFVGALVALGLLMMFVMVCEGVERYVGALIGRGQKYEVVAAVGIAMGGVLVAWRGLLAYRRSVALEETVRNAIRGQTQDRLRNAIEHLGHVSGSVRLGGAYELVHLARDVEELRLTVLDVLCAHVRRTTRDCEYRIGYRTEPSEEVSSILGLLFVQEHRIFEGSRIDLRDSYLVGIDLRGARLRGADLRGATLCGGCLEEAHLQEAALAGAGAHGLNLRRARLQMAVLTDARLYGADLSESGLQAADLRGVRMQAAVISGAQMQGARFGDSQLQGVRCRPRVENETFRKRIQNSAGVAGEVSGATFAGGLSSRLVAAMVGSLSTEGGPLMESTLREHVGGEPLHAPPTGGGVDLQPYTQPDGDAWIEECVDPDMPVL